LNHYAKGYFGGLYTLVAQGADVVGKAVGEKEARPKDYPFVNRFFIGNDDLKILPDDVNERFYDAK
jgi:hypothetical protein